MHKTTTLALAITLAIGIGTGCSKTDPTAEPAAVAAPAADTNATWAPEIAKKPAVHDAEDGEDHSGHDH
jgi:hypothetical protein